MESICYYDSFFLILSCDTSFPSQEVLGPWYEATVFGYLGVLVIPIPQRIWNKKVNIQVQRVGNTRAGLFYYFLVCSFVSLLSVWFLSFLPRRRNIEISFCSCFIQIVGTGRRRSRYREKKNKCSNSVMELKTESLQSWKSVSELS